MKGMDFHDGFDFNDEFEGIMIFIMVFRDEF